MDPTITDPPIAVGESIIVHACRGFNTSARTAIDSRSNSDRLAARAVLELQLVPMRFQE